MCSDETKLPQNIYILFGGTNFKRTLAIIHEDSTMNTTLLWHLMLGHIGEKDMKKLHKINLIKIVKT